MYWGRGQLEPGTGTKFSFITFNWNSLQYISSKVFTSFYTFFKIAYLNLIFFVQQPLHLWNCRHLVIFRFSFICDIFHIHSKPKVTYSDPKLTHSDPTHLHLPHLSLIRPLVE